MALCWSRTSRATSRSSAPLMCRRLPSAVSGSRITRARCDPRLERQDLDQSVSHLAEGGHGLLHLVIEVGGQFQRFDRLGQVGRLGDDAVLQGDQPRGSRRRPGRATGPGDRAFRESGSDLPRPHGRPAIRHRESPGRFRCRSVARSTARASAVCSPAPISRLCRSHNCWTMPLAQSIAARFGRGPALQVDQTLQRFVGFGQARALALNLSLQRDQRVERAAGTAGGLLLGNQPVLERLDFVDARCRLRSLGTQRNRPAAKLLQHGQGLLGLRSPVLLADQFGAQVLPGRPRPYRPKRLPVRCGSGDP